jgi:flagellar protein FliS
MKAAALAAYQKVDRAGLMEGASPLGLVRYLFEDLGSLLYRVEDAAKRGAREEKGEAIARALSILHVLQSTLDFDNGGEIALNLQQLYEWLRGVLVRSIRAVDPDTMAQARRVVGNLTEAWQQIGK